MRIKEILTQTRRDFIALYECESCGHEHEGRGYDDANFHQNVVPKKACPKCGATAPDNYRALGTRYAEGVQV